MATSRKQIAVLGAGGFVGKALCSRLKKTPHRVVALTRKNGDLADLDFCRKTLKNKNVVYYLAAAKKNIAHHTERPFDFVRDNTLPLLTVLEALKHLPPQTFVYVSSVLAEYANDEDAEIDGYVLGKRIGELALRAFAKQTGWNVKIVRSAAVYGPQPTIDPKTANVIPSMIDRIRKSEDEFMIWGTGKRKLQFIHVDDLSANLVAIGLKKTPSQLTVGNPETVTVDELARLILKKLGKRLRIAHDTSKPDKPTKLFRFENPVPIRYSLSKGLDTLIYG
jgi:nucleoside-diphosphate-sugar epimerase